MQQYDWECGSKFDWTYEFSEKYIKQIFRCIDVREGSITFTVDNVYPINQDLIMFRLTEKNGKCYLSDCERSHYFYSKYFDATDQFREDFVAILKEYHIKIEKNNALSICVNDYYGLMQAIVYFSIAIDRIARLPYRF